MCNFHMANTEGVALPNPQNPIYGTGPFEDTFNKPDIINLSLDAATSNCTIPFCLTQLYEARIDFLLNGTDGNVTLKIEQSIDNVNWFPFNPQSLLSLDQSTSTILGLTTGLWYRFCVDADNACHTNTTGSVDINLLLKKI